MSFENKTDDILLTLCIYGEARNQGVEGMLAVGAVVRNRVARGGWYGKTFREVILKPYQFSCFNENDPNRAILSAMSDRFMSELMVNQALKECHWVAQGILDGKLGSNVKGATHYHAVSIKTPSWAMNKEKMVYIGQIRDHAFYEERR